MRVLICGDRHWNNQLHIEGVVVALKSRHEDLVVIEGEAPRADTQARIASENQHIRVEKFPADWKKYGRAAGPIRNRQMLDDGKPDEVHAFHNNIEQSKGTANMLKQAKARGIPCYLHDKYGVTRY